MLKASEPNPTVIFAIKCLPALSLNTRTHFRTKLEHGIFRGHTVQLVRAQRRDGDGGGVVPRVRVVVRLCARNILVRTFSPADVARQDMRDNFFPELKNEENFENFEENVTLLYLSPFIHHCVSVFF
jgi:hypothetical protein